MPNHRSGLRLLATGRFGWLFASQFLGVLADNIAKSAIAVLMIFGVGGSPAMAALATSLFVLPYVLFAPVAGRVSDRFAKYRVARMVKLAEIPVMGFAGLAMWSADARLMLVSMFLAGMQATFFSPVKYAILPELVAHDDLVGANAQIESGTFLAILLGTIGGGLLGGLGASPITLALLPAISAAGAVAAFLIPPTQLADPGLSLSLVPFAGTAGLLRMLRRWRRAHAAAIALSWFWMGGAILLAEIPTYAAGVLHQGATAGAILLGALAFGIGAGSTAYGIISGSRAAGAVIPLGFVGMGVLTAAAALVPGTNSAALAIGGACLFGAAFCGGLLSVPLYVALQEGAPAHGRAQAVSGSNLLNAIYMAAGSAAAAAIGFLAGPLGLSADQSVRVVLLLGAGGLAFAAIPACLNIPEAAKPVLGRLLLWLYRVEVTGLEHLDAAGPSAVIAPNHVSWIDGALIAAALPGRPEFAVDTQIARTWWARWAIGLVDSLPLDPTSPMAIKTLVKSVRSGRQVVIFPEGRLTRTGGLMKIYDGLAMVADLAGAPIVPVRIEGARQTPWTKLGRLYRRRLFPRIAVRILPPARLPSPHGLAGEARRTALARSLYDVMSEAAFRSVDTDRTLFGALADAAHEHGDRPIVEDREGGRRSYGWLIRESLVIGRALSEDVEPGRAIGLLLPNLGATVAALFGVQAFGRVPAMLDHAAGADGLLRAIRMAGIATIITSRRFVAAARLEETVEALGAAGRIVYLEDCAAGPMARLRAMLDRIVVERRNRRGGRPDDPALIVFTAGSEGAPKGVVLSHRNLTANIAQIAARITFSPADVVLNILPLSHSFGLTAGLLLPVLSGVRTVLHPNPLQCRIVPEIAYDADATILFATDSFLTAYAATAHPYDFHTLRSVVAGAERVRPETRQIWAETFGVRILEGYGTTEAGPVLAINTPMHARAGTVGRLLPGIEARLEPVEGIADAGRLILRGPNIMLGYLTEDEPGAIRPPPPDGWHDTGDIVAIDDAGFVTVIGRAGRFARVSGAMVSLAMVEDCATALWPEDTHAAVALPDMWRGARIVLVSTRPGATSGDLAACLRGRDLPEAAAPAEIVYAASIPAQATGRTDWDAVRAIAGRPRIWQVA